MDDLAGLDWNASTSKQGAKPTAPPGSNYFPSLRPTPPVSGRSTPAVPSNPSKPATPLSNASTGPAKDSFANLFAGAASANSTKNLSLAEQQRRLQEQKARQNGTIGGAGVSEDAWSRLGTGSPLSLSRSSSTQPPGQSPANTGSSFPLPRAPKPPQSLTKDKEDEDDLLAGFSADAPVDKSSHLPVPTTGVSPARMPAAPLAMSGDFGAMPDDDDDPFGLGMSSGGPSYKPAPTTTPSFGNDDDGDDDILGDLGKDLSELAPKRKAAPPAAPEAKSSAPGHNDRAVAELVDMGFSAEKSQEALAATGGKVQAAVSWLLTQAHAEARSKSQTPADEERASRQPAQRDASQRREGRSPADGEKDPSQVASELGASLWKGANSLWKNSKKHITKAVADFNEGGNDPSQPKWMREASSSRPSSTSRGRTGSEKPQPDATVTDEAMMLDSQGPPPQRARKPQTGSSTGTSPAGSGLPSRDQSPSLPSRPTATSQSRPAWQQQAPPPRSKLSRLAVEEETTQAYVSPARRKKATAKPVDPEPDLLNGDSAPVRSTLTRPSQPGPKTASKHPAPSNIAPAVVRPAAKARPVPTVSPISMKSCNQHRAAGTAAFKRGDYGAAAESYSSAISALPASHPLTILLFTNRATTRVKTGDSKGALADADAAIKLIGPAQGSGEAIDVPAEDGSGSSAREMSQFWGKATIKRAEALENMERWTDAGEAWRKCVEAGVGGSTSIQGRNRCDQAVGKAAAPKPAAPARKPAAKPAARAAVQRAPESFAAVNKMREANKAAEAVEDEKFRLADSVDERVTNWRKGKESNLRALLGSLDTVLWENSGWKKVGMGDLLQPNKVKIAYMKGIGKVHPDKLPTTATTEQQMISAAVFATLNEAWDKFKTENGL